MTVQARIAIEKRIVRRVIDDALKDGFALSVDDGEEVTVDRSTDAEKIMGATMTTDEDALIFYKGGERVGTVWFVYGNDGFDVISNYTVSLEDALAGANALAESLSE